jgi:hypothetical protein
MYGEDNAWFPLPSRRDPVHTWKIETSDLRTDEMEKEKMKLSSWMLSSKLLQNNGIPYRVGPFWGLRDYSYRGRA